MKTSLLWYVKYQTLLMLENEPKTPDIWLMGCHQSVSHRVNPRNQDQGQFMTPPEVYSNQRNTQDSNIFFFYKF